MDVLGKILICLRPILLLFIVFFNTSYASEIDDLVMDGEKEFQ